MTQRREAKDSVQGVHRTRLETWWRDLRYAVRSLCAAPAFVLVALTVLTMSVGASTAIFSVVDAVVLRALPFDESERLVAVSERHIKGDDATRRWEPVAPQNFLDWRARQEVFTGIAAIVRYTEVHLRGDRTGEPEALRAQAVTADFFPVLRVTPILGRAFTPEHEIAGRDRVAVISYALWQRRFRGAADVVGQWLPSHPEALQIVGVLPPDFVPPDPGGLAEPPQVWRPFVVPDDQRVRRNDYGYYLQVIARLRDGVSLPQAQAHMDQITAGLAAETPSWFEDRVAFVEPLHEYVTRGVSRWMFMLLGGVVGVLLIACINLASLTLIRAGARQRELGVRAALGASRWDLARGLIVESLVLSFAGTAFGIVAAWLGTEALRAALPAEVPRVAEIGLNLRVLAVAGVAAIAAGLAFGIAPALQFTSPSFGRTLNGGGRRQTAGVGRRWLAASLVVVEVAVAVVLLVGSGLFLTSFRRVTSVELGVAHQDVLTIRINPEPGPGVVGTGAARAEHFQNVLDRVTAIPGVERAALVGGGLPFRGDLITDHFSNPDGGPRGQDIDRNEISPDYFQVLGVPLRAGRFFTAADVQGSQPVVIINEAAAERHFGRRDPIGTMVEFAGTRRVVVGVVGNIRHDGPETDWRRQGFVPLAQRHVPNVTLLVQAIRGTALLPQLKQAIRSEFPDQTLPQVRTIEGFLDELLAPRRLNMILLGGFGIFGVLIASIGLYGVMASVVAQRTQEIGIRMALGALPSTVLRSVLGRACLYLASGLAIGVAGAWAVAGLVEAFLFQVQPRDPLVFAGVCALLMMVGVLAALIPARRASRVDPLIALRAE